MRQVEKFHRASKTPHCRPIHMYLVIAAY